MRIKQMLAQHELNFPCLFGSLLSAIKPIISINKCQISIKKLAEYGMTLIKQDPNLYYKLIESEDSSKEIENL